MALSPAAKAALVAWHVGRAQVRPPGSDWIYLPWAARFQALSPGALVVVLQELVRAQAVTVESDTDRRMLLAAEDRRYCPLLDGELVVWARVTAAARRSK